MAFKFREAIGCAAFILLCSAALAFQAPGGNPVSIVPRARTAPASTDITARESTLRVDASLVEIPVHVTTPDGATVTDLRRQDFHVFEDGVEQRIAYFSQDDAPLSVGLLFDSSGSMHSKLQKSAEAAAAFFKTANVLDEFFLIEFNERPKLTVPFTPDSGAIYKRIAHTKPFGRTSLLDAIHLALLQMKNAKHPRRAIVIFSDGGDNRSRYTEAEVRNATLESDVQVYAMGIFDRDAQKLTPEEQHGPHLLDDLAEKTGGRHYPVDDLDELASISERISRDLRSEYLIGYSPSNAARDGKYRQIRLQLDNPKLRTSYRHGYQAPIN